MKLLLVYWNGMHMGRAIALKLTDKEEKIVNQLNEQGMTHSELLRDALWRYFDSIGHPVNQVQQEKVNHIEMESVNPVNRDYIKHLEDEIHHLREQNQRLQDQLGGEITRLHGQIYRFSMMKANNETPRPTSVHREIKSVTDRPSEVYNFLKKNQKKYEF